MIRDVIVPTCYPGIFSDQWDGILRAIEARQQHAVLVIEQNGDEILRSAPAARETDLVYDAHSPPHFWTHLFSGAQAVEGAAYILKAPNAEMAHAVLNDLQLCGQMEYEMRAFLYERTPRIHSAFQDSIWLINSSAMNLIREADIVQLPGLAENWKA